MLAEVRKGDLIEKFRKMLRTDKKGDIMLILRAVLVRKGRSYEEITQNRRNSGRPVDTYFIHYNLHCSLSNLNEKKVGAQNMFCHNNIQLIMLVWRLKRCVVNSI